MEKKAVEQAIKRAESLLRNVEEPLKTHAFPVVLHYLLGADEQEAVERTGKQLARAEREKQIRTQRRVEKPSRAQALRLSLIHISEPTRPY